MKLKSSLVIALLAVALSAVVAVAAPSADAKKKTGSVSTPAAGTTTSGLPVTGTFNITSFKNVDGAITADRHLHRLGRRRGASDDTGDVRRAGSQR